MSSVQSDRADDDIIRLPEVIKTTGLARTTIYRKLKTKDFPAPIQLGENSIGWYWGEIRAWKQNRPRRAV